MISYENAKEIVEIFTDIQGVTAAVRVEFDELYGRAIGKIPAMPKCREITIDYYIGDDENECEKNYLLQLKINAYDESIFEDVKSIEFEILTSVEETKDEGREEIFLKRASLMAQISMKLKFLQRDSCGY